MTLKLTKFHLSLHIQRYVIRFIFHQISFTQVFYEAFFLDRLNFTLSFLIQPLKNADYLFAIIC